MLSHPLTFLVGYLLGAVVLSFFVLAPLVVFVVTLFSQKHEKRFWKGLYLGAAVTALGFMILHYLLYLYGYGIGDWSRLFSEIFYPPRHF